MPSRKVSLDLKNRIPILHFELGYSVKGICELLGIKKSLVYQTLMYIRQYGTSHNPYTRSAGCHRILTREDVQFIQDTVLQHPSIYLDELQVVLWAHRAIYISLSTLFRTLRRLNFSSKGVTVEAIERNNLLRAVYMNYIGSVAPDPEMLMFTDETAKDDRTIYRKKGWAIVGTRYTSRECFIRGKRYSVLPVLTLDGIITHKLFEGAVTSELFVQFLREFLVS